MPEKPRRYIDSNGRKWKIVIDYASIVRVRQSEVDVDLATLLADEMKGLVAIQSDVVLFIDTLWVLVGDQHDISQEEFASGLCGDGLGEAVAAFMDAFADFCPSHQRKVLRALMAKGETLAQKAMEVIEEIGNERATYGDSESNSQPSQESERSSTTPCENSHGLHGKSTCETGTIRLKSSQH